MSSRIAQAMTAVVVVATLVGCSDSKSSSTPAGSRRTTTPTASTTAAPTGSASAPTSTAAGPDPNAPEVVAPGDIPDNQVFVPYTASGGFSIKVPEGWSRTDIAVDHVSFTDKYNTIDLSWTDSATAPTEQSASSEIAAKGYPRYQLVKASTVQRHAGPAVLVVYHRTSDPNAVTGKRITLDVEQYEFWRNGRTAVVTLSGATGSDNVDPWKTVTDGFAWT